MGFLAVLIAAIAGFAVGAVWYMTLAKPWTEDVGLEVDADGRPVDPSVTPFIMAGIAMLLVSGMMRHAFVMSGVDTVSEGLMSGLGIGLFFISPWIMINNGYARRPFRLTVIDGGYATIGCAVIGLVLTLF